MNYISFSDYYTSMDLKEVYGVYGKPHRMFIQAMLTRGIIPSGELKKLFELIMKRGATEGGAFHKMPAVNKPVIFLTIFQTYKTLLCRFSVLQFFYSFPKNIFSTM